MDRLEAAGLVERQRDTSDRRRVMICVPPDALERNYALWLPLILSIDAVTKAASEAG